MPRGTEARTPQLRPVTAIRKNGKKLSPESHSQEARIPSPESESDFSLLLQVAFQKEGVCPATFSLNCINWQFVDIFGLGTF